MNDLSPDLKHIIIAEGYLELGMIEDAANELEKIEPESKTLPPVLAVRVGIYHASKKWPEMAMIARYLVTALPCQLINVALQS